MRHRPNRGKKNRSLAVLLIALSRELTSTRLSFLWSAPVAFRRVALETPEWTSRDSNHHFYAVVYTKENVAAKALADQISDLSPPTQSAFGRLLGRIEEGKVCNKN